MFQSIQSAIKIKKTYKPSIRLPKLILGLFLYAGVCRQCPSDHLKTVGSTEVDSNVQDPRPASTSHPEPESHELSCSAQSAEEIVALSQLPPATEELEQLPAASVYHVRFQEDLINEVSSSSVECE